MTVSVAVAPRSSGEVADRPVRHAGLALAALSLGSFVIGSGEFGIMGLLPELAEDLTVSIPRAGLLVTGYALGVVFGAPVLAVLTSRMERRRTLLVLAAIFVLGNLACALSPSYGVLLAARVFTALAHGTFFGIGAVLAAEIARPGKEAQAISLMFVGMTLANVLGVPAGTFIGQAFGWRAAFWAVTGLSVVLTLALAAFVPVSHPRTGVRFRDEMRALARPQVLLAMSISVLASSALFSLYTYIAPILTDVTRIPAPSVPYVLLVFGVGMTIGNLVGARLADWKLMPSIIGLFAVMIAVLVGVHFAMADPAVLVSLLLLWGALVFGLVSPIQMRIVNEAKGARNLASTINQSAFNLGNALGAWAGAAMIGAGVPYAALPLGSAGYAMAALVVAVISWRLDEPAPSPAR
ncbi:MFS transporter [Aureimonas pseudogalii]|uniref:MFS transporter n=1 Tax=Aureimonas pseudogalii TaxID=1744844 RepID=UPI0035E7A7BC